MTGDHEDQEPESVERSHILFGLHDAKLERSLRRRARKRWWGVEQKIEYILTIGIAISFATAIIAFFTLGRVARDALFFVAMLLAIYLYRRRFQRRERSELSKLLKELGRCGNCGYDLRGSEGSACPECGRASDPQ